MAGSTCSSAGRCSSSRNPPADPPRGFDARRIGEVRELLQRRQQLPAARPAAQRPARGTALVELDEKKIAEGMQLVPRGDEKPLMLVVRSWEPVRLVAATVEGAKR